MKSTSEIIALAARKKTHPGLFALGGFVVGIIAMVLWNVELDVPSIFKTEAPAAATATPTGFPANSVLEVNAQPSGSQVVVKSIASSARGLWAAVHEVRGTTLTNVLGAARVIGAAEDFTIPLLRETVPNQSYAVVLYRDDGDGDFSLDKDSVYVDFGTGERVVSPFSTTP